MKQPKFKISDKVYHITPESDQGVVLDAEYSLLLDRWLYTVTFGIIHDDKLCVEHELSLTKTY